MRKLSIIGAAVMLAACAVGAGRMVQVPVYTGTNLTASVTSADVYGVLDEIAIYAPTAGDTGTVSVVAIHPGGTNVAELASVAVTGWAYVRPYTSYTSAGGVALSQIQSAIASTSDVPITVVSTNAIPRPVYLLGETVRVDLTAYETGTTWRVWFKTSDR